MMRIVFHVLLHGSVLRGDQFCSSPPRRIRVGISGLNDGAEGEGRADLDVPAVLRCGVSGGGPGSRRDGDGLGGAEPIYRSGYSLDEAQEKRAVGGSRRGREEYSTFRFIPQFNG